MSYNAAGYFCIVDYLLVKATTVESVDRDFSSGQTCSGIVCFFGQRKICKESCTSSGGAIKRLTSEQNMLKAASSRRNLRSIAGQEKTTSCARVFGLLEDPTLQGELVIRLL
jgi:hypothetical protein